MSNLHKETKKKFSDVVEDLYNIKHDTTEKPTPMISDYHRKVSVPNQMKLLQKN